MFFLDHTYTYINKYKVCDMSDCASSSISPYSCIKLQTPAFINSRLMLNKCSFGSIGGTKKLSSSIKSTAASKSDEHKLYKRELRLQERETGEDDTKFLEFDEKLVKEEDFVKVRGSESEGGVDLKLEDRRVTRGRRQLMRRSNMVAKQVISVQSALILGFVSQIWVDTNSWLVMVVEVRPNLLSGELERFLLEDVSQVGDVVLIQDESVMENEFKMIGLETLVGYNVVTPGGRIIGKVRGYTFNINSGTIESLELDSFGISIIPSSLVSTYALFVEDVIEVVADTVVVHEAAASHIQRVTKGIWDAQRAGYSMDELDEYSGPERESAQSAYGKGKQRRSNQKFRPKMSEDTDDWELPMDYL